MAGEIQAAGSGSGSGSISSPWSSPSSGPSSGSSPGSSPSSGSSSSSSSNPEWRGKTGFYKHEQFGTETTKSKHDRNGGWTKTETDNKGTARKISAGLAGGVAQGIGGAIHNKLVKNGLGVRAGTEVSHASASTDTHLLEVQGVKFYSAGAGIKVLNAGASAEASAVQYKASASVSHLDANAKAALIEDVLEVKARVVTAQVSAKAGFGLEDLGARAEIAATGAKVKAELSNIPLASISATSAEAKAEAGVSWKYAGASAGAYAGEVQAGPFAARAGVKFGIGVRNGIPEIDLGPVTVPACSIM